MKTFKQFLNEMQVPAGGLDQFRGGGLGARLKRGIVGFKSMMRRPDEDPRSLQSTIKTHPITAGMLAGAVTSLPAAVLSTAEHPEHGPLSMASRLGVALGIPLATGVAAGIMGRRQQKAEQTAQK